MGCCSKRENLRGVWYSVDRVRIDGVEPSSAEVLGNVADMSRDDFVRAIEIADKGFRRYSTTTTFAERGIQLRKWFELIHKNIEDCILDIKAVLTNSGKNSKSGKWKDPSRGKRRGRLCCIVHSMVQRRSSPSLWRCHSVISPKYRRLHSQTTCRRMRHHNPLEFPRCYDHQKDSSGICCRVLSCHQAT